MSELQPGSVSFLFTDVEGSTRLWEAQPRAMSVALARHDALLHAAIAAASGTVFKTVGDAFCAAFFTPEAAVAAAVAAQRALAAEMRDLATPLKVRMAVHIGPAERRAGDYFGPPLNRVARLLATAHGEQIVVSRAAGELVRDRLPAGVTLRDLGEHALKDLLEAERVYQVVTSDLVSDFPPLRTPRRFLRNLPHPATPLIGREREIASARAILGLAPLEAGAPAPRPAIDPQSARLLTLTGPGGAGKTRLSLHLAAELGGEFADGAGFVPLADVTNPALVPVAIASALEIGDTSGDSPREAVFEHLKDRHLLLVLDNFEQVMSAVPLVSDLLGGCARLRILVTSRERLSLRGEQELPLPPLALPRFPSRTAFDDPRGDDASGAIDDVRRSEAVRLFVNRVQSVKPEFDITADNAAAVVEICARLDGLPLAIELAAARIRLLSPRALLARFDRRLDVLDRGPRDLPARQQTMRDTIAWSYDLLDPTEQRFFTRLSIFTGGATLEAVAAIAGDHDGGDMDDLDLIESLADKSLLRLAGDEPRMTMLLTIRDYGQERLAESPECHTIGQRHAGFFLALAEDSEQLLAGREQTRWLDTLDQEQANLRAAIDWFRDQGRTEEALRLSGALWKFWWLRGDMGEGRQQLESLFVGSVAVAPAVRAKALNGAGVLAESQGDWERATQLHEESLRISRSIGDQRGIAWSLNNLGVVAIDQGDYDRARTLLEENLAVAEGAGDKAGIATALIDLGQIAHFRGEHERARALFTRSLALFRELGDESCMARALNNLGTILFEFGEYDRAHALLDESLDLHRHVGDRQGIASTLNNLAGAASRQGDYETAMGYFRESHMLALAEGNHLNAAIAMENLAALTRIQGEESIAQTRFREALILYRAVADQQGIVSCLAGLAFVATSQRRVAEAATLLGAVSHLCASQDQLSSPVLEETVASLRAAMGDAAFDAAWQAGGAMPINDVIDQIAEQSHLPSPAVRLSS